MKPRVALQMIEGQLVLPAVIESRKLRVGRKLLHFVIDTGSKESYLSEKETRALQMPLNNMAKMGLVRFGGATFEKIALPQITVHLWTGKLQEKDQYLQCSATLYGLRTNRISQKKHDIAVSLPSLLGMDFLDEQNFSLHVIPRERIAYLEYEG